MRTVNGACAMCGGEPCLCLCLTDVTTSGSCAPHLRCEREGEGARCVILYFACLIYCNRVFGGGG